MYFSQFAVFQHQRLANKQSYFDSCSSSIFDDPLPAFHPPARLPKSEKLLEFKLENGFCGSASETSESLLGGCKPSENKKKPEQSRVKHSCQHGNHIHNCRLLPFNTNSSMYPISTQGYPHAQPAICWNYTVAQHVRPQTLHALCHNMGATGLP